MDFTRTQSLRRWTCQDCLKKSQRNHFAIGNASRTKKKRLATQPINNKGFGLNRWVCVFL
jgi:hypothetical protein